MFVSTTSIIFVESYFSDIMSEFEPIISFPSAISLPTSLIDLIVSMETLRETSEFSEIMSIVSPLIGDKFAVSCLASLVSSLMFVSLS